jgi:hypothetical protein
MSDQQENYDEPVDEITDEGANELPTSSDRHEQAD